MCSRHQGTNRVPIFLLYFIKKRNLENELIIQQMCPGTAPIIKKQGIPFQFFEVQNLLKTSLKKNLKIKIKSLNEVTINYRLLLWAPHPQKKGEKEEEKKAVSLTTPTKGRFVSTSTTVSLL